MLFKPLMFGEASGSIGAITFSHNSGGAYTRTRVVPTDPASAYQLAARGSLSTLADYWINSLSAAQRTSWETYAANVAVPNRLGDMIFISGLAHFIRSQRERHTRGDGIVGDAPVHFDLGSFTTPSASNFAAGPPSTCDITYNSGDTFWTHGVPATAKLYIYASRPQNTTTNFFKGPYRFAGKVNGGVASPLSVTLPFNAVAGQRIFFAARALVDDGRLSDLRRFQLNT
jgi:hypothetical protein